MKRASCNASHLLDGRNRLDALKAVTVLGDLEV
jgi:hypothetical protein